MRRTNARIVTGVLEKYRRMSSLDTAWSFWRHNTSKLCHTFWEKDFKLKEYTAFIEKFKLDWMEIIHKTVRLVKQNWELQ